MERLLHRSLDGRILPQRDNRRGQGGILAALGCVGVLYGGGVLFVGRKNFEVKKRESVEDGAERLDRVLVAEEWEESAGLMRRCEILVRRRT